MIISSFPSRFSQFVTVEILTPDEDHFIISLEDMKGRITRMFGVDLAAGLNRFQVGDLEWLRDGAYCLKIKNTKGISLYSTELFKQ